VLDGMGGSSVFDTFMGSVNRGLWRSDGFTWGASLDGVGGMSGEDMC